MGILGYFRQKGGSHPIHRDVIKKKTENISEFFAKRGGGLANSKISLSEKTGASKLLGGGGGVSEFRSFSEKYQFFLIDASPYRTWLLGFLIGNGQMEEWIET